MPGIPKSFNVLNLEQKKPVLPLVVLGIEWAVLESILPTLVNEIGLTKEIGAYLPSTKLYFILFIIYYHLFMKKSTLETFFEDIQ